MNRQKKKSSIYRRRKRILLRIYLIFLFLLLLASAIGIGVCVNDIYFPFQKVDIVIDPGHGDHDPGAVADDIYEKDITLEIALETEKILKNAGYRVKLTRTDDSFLGLSERADFANNRNAKVFVSIHCNSSEDGTGQGIETYYGAQKTETDLALAERIQECLITQTEARDREVKDATFTVLVRSEMPAVLVEVGFLTNSTERTLLVDETYQSKIAEGIAEGIEAYFDENK